MSACFHLPSVVCENCAHLRSTSARPETRTFTTTIIVAPDSGATKASTYNPPVAKEPTLYMRQQVEAMLRIALTDRTDEWTLKPVDERVAALLSMFTLPTTKEKP